MSKTINKTEIIRYCPGSAVGSPAYLPEQEARERVEIDTAYLSRLATGRMIRGEYSLPHTGNCPPTCRWANNCGEID